MGNSLATVPADAGGGFLRGNSGAKWINTDSPWEPQGWGGAQTSVLFFLPYSVPPGEPRLRFGWGAGRKDGVLVSSVPY